MPNHLNVPDGQNSTSLSRRRFLRTGLCGAVFLATVSVTTGLSDCAVRPGAVETRRDASYRFYFLTADDIDLFEALFRPSWALRCLRKIKPSARRSPARSSALTQVFTTLGQPTRKSSGNCSICSPWV
jgi:hypothetical protein